MIISHFDIKIGVGYFVAYHPPSPFPREGENYSNLKGFKAAQPS